jgi:hypothetical protein
MAQYAMVPGNFSSSDTKLQIIGLDTENGDVAAAASVVQGACSGTIAGLGKVVNQKLTFTPYVKVAGGEACNITVDFDEDFKVGKITENPSCQKYHGSACGWDGQRVMRELGKKKTIGPRRIKGIAHQNGRYLTDI